MLETIGRIMIVSTTTAVNMLEPVEDGVPNSGMNPSAPWSDRVRLDVVPEHGAEHEDAPEADDDARHGGERLDERGDRRAKAAGRELGEEQRDADRERGGDRERQERGDGGAEEEAAGAIDVLDRVPGDPRHESERVLLDRGLCAADDLVRDQEDEERRGRRRGPRDDLQ